MMGTKTGWFGSRHPTRCEGCGRRVRLFWRQQAKRQLWRWCLDCAEIVDPPRFYPPKPYMFRSAS